MALAVSAGVVVVALAYALFALVRPYLGSAGAAAIVALAAAILIALIGVMLSLMARPPKRKKVEEPESFIDRVVEFVRARPVTAVAGALAAGLLAVRNPGYLGAVLRSFVEGGPAKNRGKR
jgi:uncharacterized PurR-regulated membrane protein YhhQ (DUF165 family)